MKAGNSGKGPPDSGPAFPALNEYFLLRSDTVIQLSFFS